MENKKTEIAIFQVDAFAEETFQGNPAAVCILEEKNFIPDSILQKISQEMNLSETAFIYVKDLDQIINQKRFKLRWFTPNKEVKMCGHATLASAAVLFGEYNVSSKIIEFETLSGLLQVSQEEKDFCLNFPISHSIKEENNYQELLLALGINKPLNIEYSESLEYLVVEVENEQIIESLEPDFQKMLEVKTDKKIGLVIVTSKSTTRDCYDFISRCFAPWFAINEDPVTGSAHTILYSYWKQRLNKDKLIAYQASQRGGVLRLLPSEDTNRVNIIGRTKVVLRGKLYLD